MSNYICLYKQSNEIKATIIQADNFAQAEQNLIASLLPRNDFEIIQITIAC